MANGKRSKFTANKSIGVLVERGKWSSEFQKLKTLKIQFWGGWG